MPGRFDDASSVEPRGQIALCVGAARAWRCCHVEVDTGGLSAHHDNVERFDWAEPPATQSTPTQNPVVLDEISDIHDDSRGQRS